MRRTLVALVMLASACGGGQAVTAPMGPAGDVRGAASRGTTKPEFQAPITHFETCVDICRDCPSCPSECQPGGMSGASTASTAQTPPRNELPQLPYCAPERFQPVAAGGPRGRLWEELVVGRRVVFVTEIVGRLDGAVFDLDANRWTGFGPSAIDVGPWREVFLSTAGAPTFTVAGEQVLVEWSPVPSPPPAQRPAPLPPRSAALFDPHAATWTPVAPRPFDGHHLDVSIGAVLFSFPSASTGVDFARGARLDTRTRRWDSIAAAGAPSARTEATVESVSGALFVWGGRELDARINRSKMLGDGAVYRPATNSWATVSTTAAPAPRGRGFTAVHGGRVALIGAGSALYALAEDRWSPVAPLPPQPGPLFAANDHVISTTFPSPQILDLRTNTWRKEELSVRRNGGQGALPVALPSGEIFYYTEYGSEKTPLLWSPASGALCYAPPSAEGFHTQLTTPAGAFVWRRVVRRGRSDCTLGEGWIVR